MSIIITLAIILILPSLFASQGEKRKKYNERRQTERMLRETMESVRKGGHY